MEYDKISRINAFNSLKSLIISCIDEKNINISYAINPLNEYVNGLIWEIYELQAENESLQDQLKECVNDYENDINKDNEVIKEVEEELYKSYKKNKPSNQRSV